MTVTQWIGFGTSVDEVLGAKVKRFVRSGDAKKSLVKQHRRGGVICKVGVISPSFKEKQKDGVPKTMKIYAPFRDAIPTFT